VNASLAQSGCVKDHPKKCSVPLVPLASPMASRVEATRALSTRKSRVNAALAQVGMREPPEESALSLRCVPYDVFCPPNVNPNWPDVRLSRNAGWSNYKTYALTIPLSLVEAVAS